MPQVNSPKTPSTSEVTARPLVFAGAAAGGGRQAATRLAQRLCQFRNLRQQFPFVGAFDLHLGLGIEPAIGNPLAQVLRRNRSILFQIASDDFIVCHNRAGFTSWF